MSDPTMTNPNEPKISFNIKQPEDRNRILNSKYFNTF